LRVVNPAAAGWCANAASIVALKLPCVPTR